jgi:hypothetical protein
LARDQLQGRRIDYMAGSTLKAEMAKKNLHTKRPASGEELVGMLMRTGRLAGLVGGLRERAESRDGSQGGRSEVRGAVYRDSGSAQGMPSAKEAWDSWPHSADGLTPTPTQQHGDFDHQRSMSSAADEFDGRYYQNTTSLPSVHSSSSQSEVPTPSGYAHPSYPSFGSFSQPSSDPNHSNSSQLPMSMANFSSPLSSRSVPIQRHSISGAGGPGPTDSKALLALAEEADELEMEMEWNMGAGSQDYTPRKADRGYPGPRYSLPGGQAGMGLKAGQGSRRGEISPTSPTGTSEALSETSRSLGGNPADMNPPVRIDTCRSTGALVNGTDQHVVHRQSAGRFSADPPAELPGRIAAESVCADGRVQADEFQTEDQRADVFCRV